MTGNESNPQEKGTRLESVNADLREQQANSSADLTKQPLFPLSSSSPTQPAGMVPASAQVTPPQTGGQEAHSSWQFQEFPATPISVPPMPGGQQRDVIARQQLPTSSRPTKSTGTLDAFISYSRRDDAFARQLVEAFDQRRYNAWFDRNDVLPAGEFWDDIKAGIEEAGAFLFIMSPDSLASGPCIDELNYALQCGKKIIPLHHRPIDRENVPEQLRKLDWIEGASFDEIFEKALNALLTDKEDWKQAGRWLRSGSEWQKNQKQNAGLLLHGKDLKKAEEWLKKSELEPDKRPQPLLLHTQFIHESRRFAKRTLITRIVILVLFIAVTAGGAFAFLYHDPTHVTTLSDSGTGSLRWCINNAPSGSTITFASGLKGVITLTSGEIIMKGKLTIDGPGAGVLAVKSADSNSALFTSPSASIILSGLSFRDSSFSGMSFLNNSGTLSLVNSALLNNRLVSTAGDLNDGGAIYNNGVLSIRDSYIMDNSALNPVFVGTEHNEVGGGLGGGIYNADNGTVTLMNSTIAGNSADLGGGIESFGGRITVMNSTISGNSALQEGGGIDTTGPLTLINSTLANNTVGDSASQIKYGPGNGGGISAWYQQTGPEPLLLAFDTVYGNTSSGTGGAIENNKDMLTVKDSILVGNTTSSGADIAGQVPLRGPGDPVQSLVTTEGHNLFQNVDGVSFADPNGLEDTDRIVMPGDLSTIFGPRPQLQDNGAATKTYALLPGPNNPAIGKIPLDDCHIPEILNKQSHQYTDQRGTPRPSGKEQRCDIGAYEMGEPPVAQAPSASLDPTPATGPFPLGKSLTEFSTGANPPGSKIIDGPDGNVWFITGSSIGRITPTGTITQFPLNQAATGITAGPDGNVWFTATTLIGRITPTGRITEFSLPTGQAVTSITAGSDGNVWFDSGTFIGRITPTGRITRYPLPTGQLSTEIASGPDGNLWFDAAGNGQPAIGRITPTGTITEFSVSSQITMLSDMTAGPDGNVWFAEASGYQQMIGRITPTGTITEFPLPPPEGTLSNDPEEMIFGMTTGPDGNVWFTQYLGNQIGRITPAGVITEFSMNTPQVGLSGITRGPHDTIWFTEQLGNKIGRIDIGQLIHLIAQSPSTVTPNPTPTTGPLPLGESLTEFPASADLSVSKITAGPDGNLWFTTSSSIGRITSTGTITQFPLPAGQSATGITAGPDGNLWFAENGSQIGRITPTGTITEFPLPTGQPAIWITAGPDGNVWFDGFGNHIGRITPTGTVTEFPLPTGQDPLGITAGPGGDVWFIESGNHIGRITPTGTITQFPLSTSQATTGITAGPDGNLWFTATTFIGRITPAGTVTQFSLPPPESGTFSNEPDEITTGPDGNLWFTQYNSNQIGRITPAGMITEFSMNTPDVGPGGITGGPHDTLWVTEQWGNKIGRITLGQLK